MSHSKDALLPQQELKEPEYASSEQRQNSSHKYVEKSRKYENATSHAWLFSLFGITGFVLLVLFWTGFFSLQISFSFKLLSSAVSGILCFLFLIFGIKAFHDRKKLRLDKADEECHVCQITQWFQEYYSADAISNGMDEEDLSVEQLYFLRWENISRILTEQFGYLEASFLEYMAEKIYQMYFPE
ncbi:MAG: hypothetical protein HFH41_06850 [Lachnospiraceae bacterium]|nr:hypothetical protein [Lachnospiraceae bacterium]